MKTKKIFLVIGIFVLGFVLTASSKKLDSNPVVTNIEISNEFVELSNQLINDPFCDTDYIVERQKELLDEYWYQEHKQKLDKKQHGKGHGKFDNKNKCSKKDCKKDCKKECLKHKDSPRGKDFEKRGEFKKEFGSPMFHGNDTIKFEHPKR